MAGHKVQAFVIAMMSIMTSRNLSLKWIVLNCLRKTLDGVVDDAVLTWRPSVRGDDDTPPVRAEFGPGLVQVPPCFFRKIYFYPRVGQIANWLLNCELTVKFVMSEVCHILVLMCAIYWLWGVPYTGSEVCHILVLRCAIFWFRGVPCTGSEVCHILVQRCAIYWLWGVPYTGSEVCHILVLRCAIPVVRLNYMVSGIQSKNTTIKYG